VGRAYQLAAMTGVRGAFNIAADPILDPEELGRLLGAHPVKVSPRVLRTLADVTWKLRLQPTPAGWLDMALAVPLMDTSRARAELGWTPRHSGGDALLELMDGMRQRAGIETPPLATDRSGPLRVREFLTGLGGRPGSQPRVSDAVTLWARKRNL
jgi:nucleoside-diphosphate-sugar epimerase